MSTLKSITLKNFKVFGAEPYTIDFEGADLFVFSGPNGFGKTSVFDAIELALTGNIERLIALENKQIPSDVVVAHNNAQDVEVIIEVAGEVNRTLCRRLKNPVPKDSKKISNFSALWNFFELVDSQWHELTTESIDQILGSTNFARDYRLFHYIQQEDSSRFLKGNSEAKRAEQLSQLFGGTQEVERKLVHLHNVCKKIENLRTSYSHKIKLLNKLKNDLPVLHGEDSSATYRLLFPWLHERGTGPLWDNEDFAFADQAQLTEILGQLSSLRNFIQHRQQYLVTRAYNAASKQTETLTIFVKYFLSLPHLERYQQIALHRKLLVQSLNNIDSRSLIKLRELTTKLNVFSLLGLEGAANFTEKLDEISNVTERSSATSQQRSLLNRHLEDLRGLLPALLLHDCPLCGEAYPDNASLISACERQSNLLSDLLSEQEKRLVLLWEILDEKYLTPLRQAIVDDLADEYSPSDEELAGLVGADKLRERMLSLTQWLESEKIDFDDILCSILPQGENASNIEQRVEELSLRIKRSAPPLSQSYLEHNIDNQFETIYRDLFLNNKTFAQSLSENDVDQKVSYLRVKYNKATIKVIAELRAAEEKSSKLTATKESINSVAKILENELKQYRKKLITDIEIPFYIYSGKILQSHQAGTGQGVFLKDPRGGDELKNIRFVSNWTSDHDILNTMSSGQISGVVISLTLSLNKVYARDFSSILIDDPVQTMDDINMSSLVELLRNEFSSRQILISTHEEKFSRYISYKFKKYQRIVKNLDLISRAEFL